MNNLDLACAAAGYLDTSAVYRSRSVLDGLAKAGADTPNKIAAVSMKA